MLKLENFTSVKPALELRKFIDSYYFHSCDNPESILNYTYYPHVKHAVTIYLGSVAVSHQNRTVVKPNESANSVLYSTVRDCPQHVEINGSFRKIGIVFKPYGLNHFISRPIQEFHSQVISEFTEWNPDFMVTASKVWETELIGERIALLDSFMTGIKTNFANSQFSNIIEKIVQSENMYSIEDTAKFFGFNRKTFYRLFLKELQCSPSKFLKILRFRKSLESYITEEKTNLSSIALAHFYDQSDFIRNVKQITAQTPSKLSKDLSNLENTIFWKID